MVPAVTATGVVNSSCCHPDDDSLVKFPWAKSVPVELHSAPTCNPVLVDAL